jgi:hypothetical protein
MDDEGYASPAYFARRLKASLRDNIAMINILGGGVSAQQTGKDGERVHFRYFGLDSDILFEYRGETPFVTHEISIDEGKRFKEYSCEFNYIDTFGSISNDSMREFIKDFILGNIKKFNAEK